MIIQNRTKKHKKILKINILQFLKFEELFFVTLWNICNTKIMSMKTVYTIMFFIFILLLSCNTLSRKISPSQLPEAAQAFLKEHFPDRTIVTTTKDWEHGEKGFEVWLNDGTEVEFWKDGSWREIDGHKKPIPTAFIDPLIVSYVQKNYPNEKITHIDYGHKKVDVDLTKGIDLDFEHNGQFIRAD